MQNNRLFQNLPPDRQAQIRKNLENWNSLTPAQRDAIRERAEILERMTPAAEAISARRHCCPNGRRCHRSGGRRSTARLRVLQTMGPAAQQAALADPKFMQGLNPDEQSMLRDLNSFRNPPSQ